jgi:transaldolase
VSNSNLQHVKLFADGADLTGILALYADPAIRGFTTNPTLMRQAGIDDYESFARSLLDAVPDRPISLEVFADDAADMERQAVKIASWGDNVYVKIPVTNTQREFMGPLLRRLVAQGVKVNVTAMMTVAQVERVLECIAGGPPAYVSVFAGRVADTGRDPIPIMCDTLRVLAPHPDIELIWASPREILNIVQADQIGCDIITVTHDLLKKIAGLGKDLDQFSLETVQMFHRDASESGFQL